MKPKKRKKGRADPALVEAVFERFMAFTTRLYGQAVEALQGEQASETVLARFSSDFEKVMSLRRQLFTEDGGTSTVRDLQERLPDNVWLQCEIKLAQLIIPKEVTAEDRKALRAEARRIKERKKNI